MTDIPTSDRGASIEWIERLIRIDTTSRGSNLGLIETVRDYLQHAGFIPELTYDRSGRKANLFATLADAEGGVNGGVVLSGHTDVVPVDGQPWSSDPFQPVIRDGRLYGRGACDMKGFIGSALAMVPEIPRERLRVPLHFALSYDEEVGCAGAPSMIEGFLRRGIRPSGCVVGEPTLMAPVTAHKGINAYKCIVTGRAAHSSRSRQAVNAVEYAAKLIVFIRDLADRLAAEGARDEAFDVPFTTAATGLVRGGIAINVIPDSCEVVFEYRNLPRVDPETLIGSVREFAHEILLPPMRQCFPGADIAFARLAQAPSFEGDEAALITRRIRELTRTDAVRKVAYATEAGQFQAAGVPAVVCGPGSIEQAHQADEFVSLEQIRECDAFLRELILVE